MFCYNSVNALNLKFRRHFRISGETVEVLTRMIKTAGTIFMRKTTWKCSFILKKLLKIQIKIILVHQLFWPESIHMTFCVWKFYVLERQKINPFTLTKDKKLTFKLSVINILFTKKVGGVEQSEQLKSSFTLFQGTGQISVEKNACTEKCPENRKVFHVKEPTFDKGCERNRPWKSHRSMTIELYSHERP